jgi:hypothetical protein
MIPITDDQRTMLQGLTARSAQARTRAAMAKLEFEGAARELKALELGISAMLAALTGDYTGRARADLAKGVITFAPDAPRPRAEPADKAVEVAAE